MTDENQVLTQDRPDLNGSRLLPPSTAVPNSGEPAQNQAWIKVAIGAIVGATLGGIAGALADKKTVDRLNRSVKDAGESLKRTTADLNRSVQDVGDAVLTLTTNVTDTTKDVGGVIRETAGHVNSSVQNTVNTLRSTANELTGTVQETVNSVKDATEGVRSVEESSTTTPDQDTLYKLIPVEPTE